MLPIIISAIESPEDRDLMTDFYLKHNALLYHEAHKHLSLCEDVEDIVYEALAKIIEKMDVFRDLQPKQQIQYALTTVKNLSYILSKRNNHFTMVSFEDMEFDIPADDGDSTEAIAERNLLAAHLKQIWSEISIDERMLLEQKYLLRWTDNELAETLGIKPQSVRMRLTRAKRSILMEMQRKGFHLSEWQ